MNTAQVIAELTGPAILIPGHPAFYMSDVRAITRGRGDWLFVLNERELVLSDVLLKEHVHAFDAAWELASDAPSPEQRCAQAVQHWLQQHYLEHWEFLLHSQPFQLWRMIKRNDITQMPYIEAKTIARLFPGFAAALEMNASPEQQVYALLAHRATQQSTPSTLPDLML